MGNVWEFFGMCGKVWETCGKYMGKCGKLQVVHSYMCLGIIKAYGSDSVAYRGKTPTILSIYHNITYKGRPVRGKESN